MVRPPEAPSATRLPIIVDAPANTPTPVPKIEEADPDPAPAAPPLQAEPVVPRTPRHKRRRSRRIPTALIGGVVACLGVGAVLVVLDFSAWSRLSQQATPVMPSSELTDTELQALAAEPLRPAEVQFPSMSEVVTPAAVPTFERDAYTLLTAPLLQHSNPVPDASFRPEAFWRVSGGSATGQIPADPDSAFVWTPVDRVLSAKASPASLPLLTAPIPWTQTPPDKDQLVASGPGATDTLSLIHI